MSEQIICRLCEKPTHPGNMNTRFHYVVRDGVLVEKTIAQTTWCRSCHRLAKFGHDESLVTRRRALRDEGLLLAWDGASVKQCRGECARVLPDVLFQWKIFPKERHRALRSARCLDCANADCVIWHKRRAAKVVVPRPKKSATPFEAARALIEERTGVPLERWTRYQHEVHCLLMRDMAGVAQYKNDLAPNISPEQNTLRERAIAALWQKRAQQACEWLRGETRSAAMPPLHALAS